jgi:GNAT superfamily N-acetyltransferase
MIRPARIEDREQIKALWMQAFEDDEASTDHYFAHRHRDEYMLTDMEGGRLRAMLSMLPIDLVMGKHILPARYFFAIATDLNWRGQGISTKLILAAETLCQQQGADASVLVPAGAGLFDFYGRRGYRTEFYYRAERVTPDELPVCPQVYHLLPVTKDAMYSLREKAFSGSRLFLRWDTEALDYIIASAAAFGAPLLRFKTAEGEGYAYCEPDGETIIVKELALAGITMPEAVAILHRQLKAKSYLLRLAGVADGESGLIPFGMMKAFTPLPSVQGGVPYLSFAKD